MPNIDYLSIEKVGEKTVLNRRFDEALHHLEVLNHNSLLPEKMHQNIENKLKAATSDDLTYSAKKTFITDAGNFQKIAEQILPLCEDYKVWKEAAQQLIDVSIESTSLSSFTSKVARADQSLSQSNTQTATERALSNLKSAVTTYLKSDGAAPREGEVFDFTLFLTNPDFSATDGWQGEPTYRSGCGEEFNKSFDMYQTLTSMRPGVYTICCNALYRTGSNDGGAAYKTGRENIQAYLYVNDKSVKIKSLYSEPWPEASQYGSVDNQKGYPHSMYAAGLRFAEGCYQNQIEYTLSTKGSLQIGLTVLLLS